MFKRDCDLHIIELGIVYWKHIYKGIHTRKVS